MRTRDTRPSRPQAATRARADVVIVGAGAAGLAAAIWAGRARPGSRVVALDGARRLGGKILMSGGGRCNVTHDRVEAADFSGSSRHAVEKVIRRFGVDSVTAFFSEIGVALEREATGKLFPASGRADTVLEALLLEARRARAEILHPRRVDSVRRTARGFVVAGAWGRIEAARVVLATGGRSYPKTGSDGHGHAIACSLGHTVTPLFPALVPLTLPRGHFVTRLSGLSVEAAFEVVSADGKRIASSSGSALCAHFGLSGPAVLDISRHYIEAHDADRRVRLFVSWLPRLTTDAFERSLVRLGAATVSGHLEKHMPDRLAAALCAAAALGPRTRGDQLRRDERKRLSLAVTRMVLPVAGNRGFAHAEVTAGGVPLSEVRLETMESRVCPGLYLCGEICDVDGRIGGFNFHWAWASGYAAGAAAGGAAGNPPVPA